MWSQELCGVDALEKVTGRAKYTEDLCDKALILRGYCMQISLLGIVRSLDTSEAQNFQGCKDRDLLMCPKYYFSTARTSVVCGSTASGCQDRLLLTEHVRFYGDDVAAVVAENEVAAAQALRLIR